MLVKLPKEVRKIMTELQNAGFEVYIEGECIRESVMGRSPYGWDLITDAGIDQMKELFPEAMGRNGLFPSNMKDSRGDA